MTEFEKRVGRELAYYADGDGDMAHDVLDRIQRDYKLAFGKLPEVEDE